MENKKPGLTSRGCKAIKMKDTDMKMSPESLYIGLSIETPKRLSNNNLGQIPKLS
jgi:hypothetical protein